MPSKTKNRRNRNKTKNGRNTRGQRGGGYFSDFTEKLFGPSDPSGKSWWERLTSSSPTVIETNTNPMQSNNTSDTSTSNTSTSSNSVVDPDTPTYNSTKYGGKKSKSKSSRCSRKHKHSKSCYK